MQGAGISIATALEMEMEMEMEKWYSWVPLFPYICPWIEGDRDS